MDLPLIRVRQGRLRWVDVDHDLRVPFDEMPLSLSMVPTAGGQYLITFEERHEGGQPAIAGQLSLDPRTGQARLISGTVPIPNLDKALPGKYRQWRQRYNIRGEALLASSSDATTRGQTMECRLVDVSLNLPPAEGGLELVHAAGTVLFDEAGVTLRDISGQIPAAGGAEFALSGRYEGYDADSAFRLTTSAQSVSLPDPSQAQEGLAALLEKLSRDYGLVGRCDLTAEIWREPGGTVDFRATAQPQGMTATCRHAPYRLEDIRGQVNITPAGGTLRGVLGRRHGAQVILDGVIVPAGKPGATVVSINGKDVLLDRELRDAMPSAVQKVWDVVDPSGRLSGTVKLTWDGKGSIGHVDAIVEFTGQTSLQPRDFPYRVDNLIGRATIRDRDVIVEDVRGSRGVMTCRVNGRILSAGRDDTDMDLTVEARRLPVDQDLAAAMPPQARDAMASLHAAGWAERVDCRLLSSPTGTFHYEVQAAVNELSFRPDAIPCQVSDARGQVHISPDRITLQDLTGACGPGTVVITGQATLGKERLGLDLFAQARDLQMDDRLLAALPTALGNLSDRLSVSGPTDIDLAVTSGPDEGPADYQLEVRPRDMQVRHKRLGVEFSGVHGTVLANPRRVQFVGLAAGGGSVQALLDGEISSGAQTFDGDVRLTATGLSITPQLMAAIPAEADALASRFPGGGTVGVDIRRLTWHSPRQSPTTASAAASTPASAPTSAPSTPGTWDLDGRIQLTDAVVDLDFGQRTFSGAFDGRASAAGGSLALEADMALSQVQLGQRRLSDVRGRLLKPANAAMMRIDGLAAKVHGGQVAGFAEIALTAPLRYGVSLSVENLNLHDLFHSGGDESTTQPAYDVAGILRGNIQMTATAGRPESRQATGVLKISDARFDRLPVVLGFVHVIYLWLPGQSTFAEGDVTYRLQGDNLIFEEIWLRGPAMSVLGSGRVNMSDESLRLTFLTGPPGYLPRLAGVEGLMRGITREIGEVRVTGTLAKPMPRTVSLPGLEEAVQRVLSPEQQGDE